MPQVELLLPKMGESVAEATIVKWLKKPGDQVEEDDIVLEVATDKVDSEVPSPVSGTLLKYLCDEEDIVQVGTAIAIIETGGSAGGVEETGLPQVQETVPVQAPSPAAREEEVPGIAQLNDRQALQPVRQPASGRFYSPLVKNIAAEEGISPAELDTIPGTGSEGRVTREDIMVYLGSRRPAAAKPEPVAAPRQAPEPPAAAAPPSIPQPPAAEPAPPAAAKPAPEPVQAREPRPVQSSPAAPRPQAQPPVVPRGAGDEIIEMDRMRRIIADHMVMSVQTSPHVCSFVEADVTNLVKWRERVKNLFEKREGEKITFTPLFVEAVAKAIRDMPMINVSVDGNRIIKKRDINIGMAAALPSGNLIVPVIKNADQLNLVGLSKAVNDLAGRSRTNKLQPDEIKDGTFTITNIGTFGNIMGTPIINQPQVAILAIGVIKKKPAVIESEDGDMIGIRHMTYLSLSYDHRVVDGALGGMFLRRIADYLENWDVDREI